VLVVISNRSSSTRSCGGDACRGDAGVARVSSNDGMVCVDHEPSIVIIQIPGKFGKLASRRLLPPAPAWSV
jgi:hypothetical protein